MFIEYRSSDISSIKTFYESLCRFEFYYTVVNIDYIAPLMAQEGTGLLNIQNQVYHKLPVVSRECFRDLCNE
jgi:hypothetical protein